MGAHDNPNCTHGPPDRKPREGERALCFQRIERFQVFLHVVCAAVYFALPSIPEANLSNLAVVVIVSTLAFVCAISNLMDEVVELRWPEVGEEDRHPKPEHGECALSAAGGIDVAKLVRTLQHQKATILSDEELNAIFAEMAHPHIKVVQVATG